MFKTEYIYTFAINIIKELYYLNMFFTFVLTRILLISVRGAVKKGNPNDCLIFNTIIQMQDACCFIEKKTLQNLLIFVFVSKRERLFFV